MDHWLVDRSLALPMTLKLTDKKGHKIVNYKPHGKKWWITGFNPYYQNVKATYTIDFSSKKALFKAFYKT
ncbi:hypothetical protein bsdtb5_07370 [Anaeromicropila herbilytica]|uniref:Uncharacterized protein n=2 Tax=Anaeromicropila herbilytica TaxID=2785025 RepID=A0A7R7EIK6_9FIRM|nr:hypothetical protein bsdtb5_07370 [Anaeromicropila herbilytica]